MMIAFRIYLLAGLVAHKALWEAMKRRQGHVPSRPALTLKTRLVKTVKLTILAAILIQTVWPDDVLSIIKVGQIDPFTIRVIGFLLYTLGLAVAVLGRVQLGDNWSDIEQGSVIEKQAVKDDGIYRYIRHPIYTGDLLLLVGLQLSLNSWFVLAVVALAPIVMLQTIKEEKILMQNLTGYDQYAQRTKRFIPFII